MAHTLGPHLRVQCECATLPAAPLMAAHASGTTSSWQMILNKQSATWACLAAELAWTQLFGSSSFPRIIARRDGGAHVVHLLRGRKGLVFLGWEAPHHCCSAFPAGQLLQCYGFHMEVSSCVSIFQWHSYRGSHVKTKHTKLFQKHVLTAKRT